MSNLQTTSVKLFKTVALKAKIVVGFYTFVGHIAKIILTRANSILFHAKKHQAKQSQLLHSSCTAFTQDITFMCSGEITDSHHKHVFPSFLLATTVGFHEYDWEWDNFISQQKCHWQYALLLALPMGWRENNWWKGKNNTDLVTKCLKKKKKGS